MEASVLIKILKKYSFLKISIFENSKKTSNPPKSMKFHRQTKRSDRVKGNIKNPRFLKYFFNGHPQNCQKKFPKLSTNWVGGEGHQAQKIDLINGPGFYRFLVLWRRGGGVGGPSSALVSQV